MGSVFKMVDISRRRFDLEVEEEAANNRCTDYEVAGCLVIDTINVIVFLEINSILRGI